MNREALKERVTVARQEAERQSDPSVRIARRPRSDNRRLRGRCQECGRVLPYWTRERIIAAIQRWNREYGSPPKNANWQPRSTSWHPTIGMVRLVFGSWNEALIAAGFPVRHRRWTKDEVIQAMFAWAYEYGHPPTANEWRTSSPDRPSETTVRNLFGSWSRGIAAAGYTPRRRGWADVPRKAAA